MGEGPFPPGGQVADADVPLPAADISSGVSRPRLCVGMATYDDFDGVWFTIQAIRLYQPEVLADVSFLVIDNHPEGPAGPALRALGEWLPSYRYVPFGGYRGTAVRDLVFREASADIVCCLDSHVLLRPGALAAVLRWFGAHPGSRDLLQGPLLYDSLKPGATHLEPAWGAGMFGQWGLDRRIDEPGGEPFEIAMHGLGLFACRRDAWPGLNPRLRGFGGEEGYLHEKFRQRGGRVLCHPRLGWLHRFSRPAGVSYPNAWEDRVRNYVLAWSEIGWDLAPIRSHFRELLGPGSDVDAVFDRARRHAGYPLNVFDGVFCLAGEAGGCGAHEHPAAISWRIECLVPGPGPGREHQRLTGWQAAVSAAAHRGYQHLLLLDESAPACVAVPPLQDLQWDLCLLPVHDSIPVPDAGGTGPLAGFAVAVHGRAFKRLLSDLPADQAGQAGFLTAWGSVDGYLAHHIADGTFTALRALPAGPDTDQPAQRPGIEVTELAAGLAAGPAGSPAAHQLNNTASVILELCDGRRTVSQIASSLADAFGLDNAPLAEVTACVAGLRSAGILADPMHYPATTRAVTGRFFHHTAESRML